MKMEGKVINNIVAFLMIVSLSLLGWVLAPFLVKDKIASYSFLFISTLSSMLYFLTKFIIKVKNEIIELSPYVLFITLFGMVVRYNYNHFGYENYYIIAIPLFLTGSVVCYDLVSRKISTVDELVNFILEIFWTLPVGTGSLLLFQVLTNSSIPQFKNSSIQIKLFLIFNIIYSFILAAVLISLKNKRKKESSNVLAEFSILISFFLIYLFTSFYLFNNYSIFIKKPYAYAFQIMTYLSITTMCVYIIILITNPNRYSKKVQKLHFAFTIFCCLLVAGPIGIIITKKYLPSFSNALLSIKGDTFVALVVSSVLGSVISSIILQRSAKRK